MKGNSVDTPQIVVTDKLLTTRYANKVNIFTNRPSSLSLQTTLDQIMTKLMVLKDKRKEIPRQDGCTNSSRPHENARMNCRTKLDDILFASRETTFQGNGADSQKLELLCFYRMSWMENALFSHIFETALMGCSLNSGF